MSAPTDARDLDRVTGVWSDAITRTRTLAWVPDRIGPSQGAYVPVPVSYRPSEAHGPGSCLIVPDYWSEASFNQEHKQWQADTERLAWDLAQLAEEKGVAR
jgi:hypothetical protein